MDDRRSDRQPMEGNMNATQLVDLLVILLRIFAAGLAG
jgi:hypothetical protein